MVLSRMTICARVVEQPPEEAVAAERGEGVQTAAEGRLQMVAVQRERSGEDEAGVVAFGDADLHGAGQRNLLAQITFEFGGAIHRRRAPR
jgi:hypothetical protein